MKFTHLDENGSACMVDVAAKEDTVREASAAGVIRMSKTCFEKVAEGSVAKGDVFAAARIAGIMAAKKTAELIPLCHILNLTKVAVEFEADSERNLIRAVCTARCVGKTGVEMEALTGVSVALLTIYDMCKAMDKRMVIHETRLLEKHGGKSGTLDFTENPGEEEP